MIIKPRSAWGAVPPSSPLQSMPTPTPVVYVHHSASQAYGTGAIKSFQHYHMTVKDMRDIAYNFLIDHDGVVYEGRGWGKAHGGNTGTDNRISHSVCLMGNFDATSLPAVQEDSLVELLREGKSRDAWLLTDVRGHRQEPGASTACPGKNVMAKLPNIVKEAKQVTAPPVEEEEEELEMIIVDSPGNPALIVCGGSVKALNKAQRNAYRTIGVEAKLVDDATSDALRSLADN